MGLLRSTILPLPSPPSLPHILNCDCCFSISQKQTDTQDTLCRGGGVGGGVNKQVNELRGGDMEFLINCNVPFPLWSRIMVWLGFHLRPYDPLCILNLRRQWTYSSPLKNDQLWKLGQKEAHLYMSSVLLLIVLIFLIICEEVVIFLKADFLCAVFISFTYRYWNRVLIGK